MSKPVILLGHGVRAAGIDPSIFLVRGIPVLTSWQAADLVDNNHAMYFGRPGSYGHRAANKILVEADHVISVGCRRSVVCAGYEPLKQHIDVYDETTGMPEEFPSADYAWLEQCQAWRAQWPWVEEGTHDDTLGYINAYRVMERMQKYLRHDEVIVTDMGTALVCAHYVLKLKPPQRLMTSGGLGEMGCALPAAIGASFARGEGEVLCLQCDGGMMQNLQELATIAHHDLPIKIVVFANSGYSMIKGTQKNLGMSYSGVDHKDLTFPDFVMNAQSHGIRALNVRTWEAFDHEMPHFFGRSHPQLMVIHIDPEQKYLPKLQPIIENGVARPPRFDQLSPLR